MTGISYQLAEKLQETLAYSSYRGTAILSDGAEREVQIKILEPRLAQDEVLLSHLAGFLDVARGLSHPSLSPIWDFGRAGDYYFIVRDHINGISLQHLFQLVQQGKAVLSPSISIYLALEIAEAMAAIHRFRVPGDQPIYLFHGGLSPENVVLTRVGNLVVTDAGMDVIYWRDAEIATRLQKQKGPHHPPEYQTGSRPMRRSDTYSVAALLYHMVVGLTPQEAAARYGDGSSSWVPPSSRNHRITEKFDQVLQQALHPDLAKRMVQIGHFQTALKEEGLLRQARVRRREAMEFIEALVKEAAPMEFDVPGPLLFDYPFQLESLLPERVELAPPNARFRLPQHESTDPYHNTGLRPAYTGDIEARASSDDDIMQGMKEAAASLAGGISSGSDFDDDDETVMPSDLERTSIAGDFSDDDDETSIDLSEEDALPEPDEERTVAVALNDINTFRDMLDSAKVEATTGNADIGMAFESTQAASSLLSIASSDGIKESTIDIGPDELDEYIEEQEHTDTPILIDAADEVEETGAHTSPELEEVAVSADDLMEAIPRTPETVALPLEDLLPSSADEHSTASRTGPSSQLSTPQGLPGAPPTGTTPETVALDPDTLHGAQSPVAPQTPTPSPSVSGEMEPERFGKFLLLNRVALGGMAEVFRAKFEGPDSFQRLVAIKRILPEYAQDDNFLQMFKDEARIAGSLLHPNIVQIYELGEAEDTYYISMEFIDGIDLARVIKIRRALQQPIPLGVALSIAIATCRALHYAHEAVDPDGTPLHMIHRDVTPHNVLISRRGEIKLADFGIAKASQNVSRTAVGELKGKLSYMSPEQAKGHILDRRSDIFQLGILLHETLTLRKMFEGNSDHSILGKIQQGDYPRMGDTRPEIPQGLDEIVRCSMSLEPGERYQSAAEMEQALLQFRDQLRLPAEYFDVSPFTAEVIEERDRLLAQYNEARKQKKSKRTFSVWDTPQQDQAPQPQLQAAAGFPTAPPANASPFPGGGPPVGSNFPSPQAFPTPQVSPNPGFMATGGFQNNPPSAAPMSPLAAGFAQAARQSPLQNGTTDAPVFAATNALANPSSMGIVSDPFAGTELPVSPDVNKNTSTGRTKLLLMILAPLFVLGIVIGVGLTMMKETPPPHAVLSVTSTPTGATIHLDGQKLGKTPLFEKKIPFDRDPHILQIHKRGHTIFRKSFQLKEPEDVVNVSAMLHKISRKRRKKKPIKNKRFNPTTKLSFIFLGGGV